MLKTRHRQTFVIVELLSRLKTIYPRSEVAQYIVQSLILCHMWVMVQKDDKISQQFIARKYDFTDRIKAISYIKGVNLKMSHFVFGSTTIT